MNYLFATLLALGVTVMLVPPLTAWADRLGVLDVPGGRKAHAHPIPRVGGIAMAAGMLLAMLIWSDASRATQGYLLGLAVLLLFGIQDDRLTLSPRTKLIGQIISALIVMQVGQVQIGMLRHIDAFDLPQWIAMPVTLVFIVGVTNAINLADGLDGLAGGATLLCLSGLTVLALTVNSMNVVFLCAVTMAAVLGFLRYNTHPARIFMGDAGSQLLGFSAAVFSLMLTQDRSLPFSAALPLLLLGVPVIDTLTVMTERLLDGRSPFQADRIHVHHRLLALGFHHHEAVMLIYGMQALMMVLAWQLRFVSDAVIVTVFVMLAAVIVGTLRMARLRSWRWRDASAEGRRGRSWSSDRMLWLNDKSRLHRWLGYVISGAMLGYALMLIANGISASRDMRWLSGAAALIVLVSIVVHRGGTQASWMERVALYVCALLAVSVDRPGNIPASSKLWIEAALFGLMTSALLIRMQLSVNRRFSISPLDLLVLLLAMVLPNLPGSIISQYVAGWVVLKVLLLMYCIEALTASEGMQWRLLTGGALVFLACVSLGGMV